MTPLILLAATTLQCLLILPAHAQPAAHIDNLLQVVQATSSGQDVTREVTITNKGTQDLKLEVEKTSCGCTGAVLSSELLAPKQTGTLTIKMQVGGWGTKTKTVTLRSNDPQQPQIVVTLQAEMPKTVVPNPARLTIQTPEGIKTQRFLSLLLPDKATISKISARQKSITARVLDSKSIEGGTLQRVEVSLSASVPAGKIVDELTIQLKDAPVPQIGVAIEGFVEPDISTEPHQLFLGQVPKGSTLRKVVVVQSHSKHPFAIKKIESSNRLVTGKASPDVTADAHAVEVNVTASGEVGSILQDTFKLTLSNDNVLEVPVFGMIVKADTAADKLGQAPALKVGAPAPDFTATDMSGNEHSLSELRGNKNLLLTFFPKCFTGGCAGHLASLQRELPNLLRSDAEIWAVSVDPAQEQVLFAAKLGLQFPLLSDTDRKLSLLYGAAQDKTDMASRQSVLIDKNGIVRWIDTDVNVKTHGADVLAKMRELGLAK